MESDSPKTITVTPEESQKKALQWAIPLIIVLGVPYVYLYYPKLLGLSTPEMIVHIVYLGGMIILGTVIHELLHGLTWALFGKHHLKSMKFGIFWKALMPYCHYKDPLKLNQYRLGLLLPGIILGILPVIWGLLTGHLLSFLFGLYFTYSAVGDFWITWKLRYERRTTLIKDHPEEIGCLVYRNMTNED